MSPNSGYTTTNTRRENTTVISGRNCTVNSTTLGRAIDSSHLQIHKFLITVMSRVCYRLIWRQVCKEMKSLSKLHWYLPLCCSRPGIFAPYAGLNLSQHEVKCFHTPHALKKYSRIRGTEKFPEWLKNLFKIVVQVWKFSSLHSAPPVTECSEPSAAATARDV
jgi:hypothetical protein